MFHCACLLQVQEVKTAELASSVWQVLSSAVRGGYTCAQMMQSGKIATQGMLRTPLCKQHIKWGATAFVHFPSLPAQRVPVGVSDIASRYCFHQSGVRRSCLSMSNLRKLRISSLIGSPDHPPVPIWILNVRQQPRNLLPRTSTSMF